MSTSRTDSLLRGERSGSEVQLAHRVLWTTFRPACFEFSVLSGRTGNPSLTVSFTDRYSVVTDKASAVRVRAHVGISTVFLLDFICVFI